MISVEEALKIVVSIPGSYGIEDVPLQEMYNRFLAKDIMADRDSPPFDRVMMDGIAIDSSILLDNNKNSFFIEGIQAAGDTQKKLADKNNCLEVMTGAILPENTDTIVPYEDIEITDNTAHLKQPVVAKKYIHLKGSDHQKGLLALPKGRRLTAADAGLVASVGIAMVPVFAMPKIAIVATGNELVEVTAIAEKHQVRMSNVYALQAALNKDRIASTIFHLTDDEAILLKQLASIINDFDVVLISGGVSKGKYDFVPAILDKLGVQKLFHQVAQRPGKPFWFGHQPQQNTHVFAFPGNPVSTFVCHQYYFRHWLFACFGNVLKLSMVKVTGNATVSNNLTQFLPVMASDTSNKVTIVSNNGSGDLFSLSAIDGFVLLPKGVEMQIGKDILSFLSVR
jgi:molybdopterin molybdotransferase